MNLDHLRKRIMGMGLIIALFLVLSLSDEVENFVGNFRSEVKVPEQAIDPPATQDPEYFEDFNRSIYNTHSLTEEKKGDDSSRRVYPYSVVNGGVRSVQELRSAIWRDPVVAEHYLNFDLGRVRVIKAETDRHFYVSYRIGNEIFWTKKRLKVAKSENLITDGTNFTRTRCANMLSETPHSKTSPHEPTSTVLDAPLDQPSGIAAPLVPVLIVTGALDPGSGLTPPVPPIVSVGGSQYPGSRPTLFSPPIVIGLGSQNPSSGPTPSVPPVVVGGGGALDLEPESDFTPSLPPSVIEAGLSDPGSGLPPSMPPVVIGTGPSDPGSDLTPLLPPVVIEGDFSDPGSD